MTHLLYIRVDSSVDIGSGHVMRCLTLANRVRQHGIESNFICRNHPGNILNKILESGHNLTVLPIQEVAANKRVTHDSVDYASWLGAPILDDARDTIECIDNELSSWLIVDHYAIDERWESYVKNKIDTKIFVIDGQANRVHNCEALLDQTPSLDGEKRWIERVPETCIMFVGPKHALLRPEFVNTRKNLRKRDGVIRRIFICFGGMDNPNATMTALNAIVLLGCRNIEVDVVIGSTNIHIIEIKNKCDDLQCVNLFIEANNVAEHMAAADLAIGGGGGMMLERSFLGLPSITISIARNQDASCEAMDVLGINIHLGNIDSIETNCITATMESLINDKQLLIRMQKRTLDFVKPASFSWPQLLAAQIC